MKKAIWGLMIAPMCIALAQGQVPAPSSASGSSPSHPVRPIGVVSQIQPGSLTLHTDGGSDLAVQLPEGVSVLRVPPGAKTLEAATKISVDQIKAGDRVFVRGRVLEDQKSVLATSVIVMTQTDLAKAREAERLEWRRRGIGGLVKAVNPEAKELTVSVPNSPPMAGNPSTRVTITLAENCVLLRYAPDSVKFSDARPSTFEEIKVGDQVRALGEKSADGSRFVAEKLVSGTFRDIGATVVSVDAPNGTVTVRDLASGNPVVVRTNTDSKLRRLPPFVAQMIAGLSSGEPASGAPPAGPQDNLRAGAHERSQTGGSGDRAGKGPSDFQQVLDRAPPLALSDLKPGEPLIVVSTEGAKPSEVTAIFVLAGVEPILAAQPRGRGQMELGPWNMSASEGAP